MTLEQAKQLKYGDVIYFRDRNRIMRWKVNGRPKTWKRNPERIEIPLKFGLYTYDRADETHIARLHLTHEEAVASQN